MFLVFLGYYPFHPIELDPLTAVFHIYHFISCCLIFCVNEEFLFYRLDFYIYKKYFGRFPIYIEVFYLKLKFQKLRKADPQIGSSVIACDK